MYIHTYKYKYTTRSRFPTTYMDIEKVEGPNYTGTVLLVATISGISIIKLQFIRLVRKLVLCKYKHQI